MKVVSLRSAPSLTDIPGQLRALAEAVEKGDYPHVQAAYVVLENPAQDAFGYGNVGSAFHAAGVLTSAVNRLLQDGV